MPSTATDSPSRSHQRASQTWQELKIASVPSGSFISIWMTDSDPHSLQIKPSAVAFLNSSSPSRSSPRPHRVLVHALNASCRRAPAHRRDGRGTSSAACRPQSSTRTRTARGDTPGTTPSRTSPSSSGSSRRDRGRGTRGRPIRAAPLVNMNRRLRSGSSISRTASRTSRSIGMSGHVPKERQVPRAPVEEAPSDGGDEP